MEVSKIYVDGIWAAIRGMRNPMNSWERSDSYSCHQGCTDSKCEYFKRECLFMRIGDNDLDLMQRLYKAGTEHRKFMRFINVSFDVTAPMYWWLEFDTYKIGTSKNSTSKMHKIHVKPFSFDDFEHDAIDAVGGLVLKTFERYVTQLEDLRLAFNESNDKTLWRALIQMLPESYRMTATISTNYETIDNMVRQRAGHKLTEWHTFVDTMLGLPYFREITGRQKE